MQGTTTKHTGEWQLQEKKGSQRANRSACDAQEVGVWSGHWSDMVLRAACYAAWGWYFVGRSNGAPTSGMMVVDNG
ncbi:hypothetical protein AC579_49 [Pseudocercospora musae]|uniref:Uncharacterized protein n=1 Tax=Pseudocercospora musae TaxID=113226 RepID=A0A139IGF3_9PEZI|nr:hypothetical protein AC579_49 [Pseudocercospora musae]